MMLAPRRKAAKRSLRKLFLARRAPKLHRTLIAHPRRARLSRFARSF
jgi:hypothetical protein